MAIVKKREIDVLAQMNGEEIRQFVENLPAPFEKIERMFEAIEKRVEQSGCDHSSRFAMQYMMMNAMDFGKVSNWLSRNGGYCDCKILSEITRIWREVFDEKGESFR
ncbi:MAG: DUF2695 domain-containing protein [Pyrinomonadaceae bacterium]